MPDMGSLRMPTPEEALPGHDEPMRVPPRHTVLGKPLTPPFPEGFERAVFGMGCFWGAERKFWELDGVYTTAVGYAGGLTIGSAPAVQRSELVAAPCRDDDGVAEVSEVLGMEVEAHVPPVLLVPESRSHSELHVVGAGAGGTIAPGGSALHQVEDAQLE